MARLPLSRALFAALCSRSTSLSVQCHCLSLLCCVTLTCHRPQHWLEWVFAQYMREVGDSRAARLRILKNGSIKVFPALFPTGDGSSGGGSYTPCTLIRNCIHVHAHENCRDSTAVCLSNTLGSENTPERSVLFLPHGFSSSLRFPHRYRGNKLARLALLSSAPITVANANNTEHRDELDPYR